MDDKIQSVVTSWFHQHIGILKANLSTLMNHHKIVGILGLFLIMFACQPESAETAKPAAASVEKKKTVTAPDIIGTTLQGTTYSSKELAGKGYILNFFATWCGPCRSEIPDMVELQHEYKQKGFTFIGIAVDENIATVQDFAKRYNINFPVLVVNQQIIDAYSPYVEGGLRAVPTSFVIRADGTLLNIFNTAEPLGFALIGSQSKKTFDGLIQRAIATGQ